MDLFFTEKNTLPMLECEITDALNKKLKAKTNHFFVYVDGNFIEKDFYKDNYLSIRVPGRTIGYIMQSLDTHQIIDVKVLDRCLNLFTENPNEIIRKYVGTQINLISKEGTR